MTDPKVGVPSYQTLWNALSDEQKEIMTPDELRRLNRERELDQAKQQSFNNANILGSIALKKGISGLTGKIQTMQLLKVFGIETTVLPISIHLEDLMTKGNMSLLPPDTPEEAQVLWVMQKHDLDR